MKSASIIHVVWALVAFIAFAVGYSITGHNAFERSPVESASHAASSSTGTSRNSSGSDDRLDRTGARYDKNESVPNSEQARDQLFGILSEPNRFKRLRQLCDLLDHVTPANCRGMIEALKVQLKTEGRIDPNEWKLIVERIGEIAGAEAMTLALNSPQGPDMQLAQELLIGWAAGNPKDATGWFKGQPAEVREQFLSNLLTEVARSDPKQAVTLLFDQSQTVWESNTPGIVEAAMQLGGYRAAEELYTSIRDRSDIPNARKGNIFYEVAQKRIAIDSARGEATATLGWLDERLSEAGPWATMQVIRSAAEGNAPATLTWLDEHAARMTPLQIERGYGALTQVWAAREPERFAEWLETSPTNPQHDTMATVVVETLANRGKLDDARRLVNTVSNVESRASLESLIQKAARSPRRQKAEQ